MAGCPGTPLPEKPGIEQGARFAKERAPLDLAGTLGELPAEAEWRRQVRPGLDVVMAFSTKRPLMVADRQKLTAAGAPNGTVWIAWPKRASRVPTDITEDVPREEFLPTGWVERAAVRAAVRAPARTALSGSMRLVRRTGRGVAGAAMPSRGCARAARSDI